MKGNDSFMVQTQEKVVTAPAAAEEKTTFPIDLTNTPCTVAAQLYVQSTNYATK